MGFPEHLFFWPKDLENIWHTKWKTCKSGIVKDYGEHKAWEAGDLEGRVYCFSRVIFFFKRIASTPACVFSFIYCMRFSLGCPVGHSILSASSPKPPVELLKQCCLFFQ